MRTHAENMKKYKYGRIFLIRREQLSILSLNNKQESYIDKTTHALSYKMETKSKNIPE